MAQLHDSSHQLIAVVTRSDRPTGRGRELEPTDTKARAQQLQIPVVEINDLKDPTAIELLSRLEAELWVVVAFPIIPDALLEIPTLGTVNLHASLLPKQNVHPKVVQERLGHATISTTLDLYSHLAPGLQEAAAVRFDEAFAPSPEKEAVEDHHWQIIGKNRNITPSG